MHYRGSMRRGVSLEVILEEDDKGSHKAKTHTKDCSTSSSSGLDETYEGGDEVENESMDRLRSERKKRKRLKEEYRNRMLMRRSVSCETLTVLDVRKDDESWQEWEEEAKHWNDDQPIVNNISRRQILETTRNSTTTTTESSEDENSHTITHLPNEIALTKTNAISRKEPYEETEQETSVDLSTEDDSEMEQYFHNQTNHKLLTEGCRTFDNVHSSNDLWPPISTDDCWISVGELENIGVDEATHETEDVTPSTPPHLPAVTIQPEFNDGPQLTNESHNHENLLTVETGKKVFDKPLSAPTNITARHLSAMPSCHVLENPCVSVIDKEPDTEQQKLSSSQNDDSEEEGIIFNRHNKELLVAELPKKHTVFSVRQLFENQHQNKAIAKETSNAEYLPYVRSNPTSRILRFDKEKNSLQRSMHETHSKILQIYTSKDHEERSFLTEDLTVESKSHINLRKPTLAKNFNIQKALMDNPRYFHMRLEEKKANSPSPTQHNPKFRDDRSDSDSWSSESSADSGVSKDFNSTILSSFSRSPSKSPSPRPTEPEPLTDPSFKWIDAAVLAKIRSVGTSVIYFGPKCHSTGESGIIRSPLLCDNDFQTSTLTYCNEYKQIATEEQPRIVSMLPKTHQHHSTQHEANTTYEDLRPTKWKSQEFSTVVYDFS